MKNKLLLITLSAFLFASCGDDKSSSDNKTTTSTEKKDDAPSTTANDDNAITFKVNGETVNSSGWNISRSIMGGREVLNITSDMHKQPKTININVNGNKAGTYKLSHGLEAMKGEGMAYGSYRPDYINDMMNTYSFQDGEINITTLDTAKNIVNATFSGTVKNDKNATFNITEGKVTNCTLKSGVTKL